MFVQREYIAEIRYYQAKKEDLEIEDLLRKISGMKPIHKKGIAQIEERINRLCWCCQDIM